MAKFVQRDVFIGFISSAGAGTVTLSNYANKCEIRDEADKVEFTGFSSNAYKEYGQGLHDATISLTLFNDFVGTATPFGQLQPVYSSGGTFGIVVRPTSSAVGTANPQWSMTGRIFAFSPLSGGIGDASSFDVDIANASSAGLTYATA